MESTKNRILLALSKLHGVGPATISRIASNVNFQEVDIQLLRHLDAKVAKALLNPQSWDIARRSADNDIEASHRFGSRIISAIDHDYPPFLNQVRDRPFFIYVKGMLPSTCQLPVAVIGTRSPTEHGKLIADRVSTFLASDSCSIISGLALGCDALAHRAALREGGHTIAVLAHGLQTVAPRQNQDLAREILDSGGALVTEYPFGVEPTPHQFAKRDRIQAGLACCVVMIQSDLEGGSLHASRAALEFERLLAVPAPTKRDLGAQEPKVKANILLSSNDEEAKMQLLRCSAASLSNLFLIGDRADYPRLMDEIRARNRAIV